MINRLIYEVNEALNHELYMAALCTVLTIPDICAKAIYPNLKNKQRYIKWYDENIGQYDRDKEDTVMPYLSGEVVYQLRCSLLHQGTPNIDKENIKEECCKIDKFIILVEKTKEFSMYHDSAEVHREGYNGKIGPVKREYTVNVQRLCMMITRVAKKEYEENRDKFDFINYRIRDWDKMVSELERKREKQGLL